MRLKRAFSLIEVLLVMGIIAVVTAMGFSISKNNMEKAYNIYWYTGYDALFRATEDANEHGFDSNSPNINIYADHLAKLMKAGSHEQCQTNLSAPGLTLGNPMCRTFTAPNGIKYEIQTSLAPGNFGGEDFLYIIDMTIPALRNRRNLANKTRFFYRINDEGFNNSLDYFPIQDGYIYPVAVNNNNYFNLMDRVDLLPFYLSDGNSTNTKTFYSFREAFCKVYGEFDSLPNLLDIKCNNIPGTNPNPDFENNTIHYINPRKAF